MVRRGAATVRDVDETCRLEFGMVCDVVEWRAEVCAAMAEGFPFQRVERVVGIEGLDVLDFAVTLYDRQFVVTEGVEQRCQL